MPHRKSPGPLNRQPEGPLDNRLHLRSLSLRQPDGQAGLEFPFSLPVIRRLEMLAFDSPVTFLVGENGSGKSTLLEALACAADLPAVGSEAVRHDETLGHARRLAAQMRLAWNKRSHRGFFLRAEDFFGYARRLGQIQNELERDLRAVDEEYKGRSLLATALAKTPYQHELGDLKQRYGTGLEQASHGEAFLKLFQARFVPDGLYLLDEPEAPLSPVRQLALISALRQMVAQKAQFIIATHSPILMAFPGALILNFDGDQIRPAVYEELEHVRLTRTFLDNPEAYLRHL